MALKDRVSSGLVRTLFLRLGLWVILGICAVLLGLVWYSGSRDTKQAMLDGRRLLVSLETGAIEGKQIALETPPVAATSPATSEAATTPATPEVTVPASPETTAPAATTPASPEASATPLATADATAPETVANTESPATSALDQAISTPVDTGYIKPAQIPIAEVKDVLLEKTANGNIPTVGPKGLKPWHYYSKPYAHKGHLPTIAIIITGLGQNKAVTENAIRLPENFSLSFSPYARDLTTWAHAARISGHEVMLDLPLEPSNFPASDPGPYGLLVGKGMEENNKRLDWLMGRMEGYVGFVSPLNEAFSDDNESFKNLLEQFNKRGLLLAMSHEPPKNDTKKLLDASKSAYAIADIVVDEELSVTGIQARLEALQKTASKRGFAIGMAQGYPLTMQQLALWSANAEKNGFVLAPVTFITNIRFPAT